MYMYMYTVVFLIVLCVILYASLFGYPKDNVFGLFNAILIPFLLLVLSKKR